MLDEHSQFIGNAFTLGENWVLWKKKLGVGTFPIALRIPFEMTQTGRIKGELFKVNSSRILELDEYKSNGVEFRRKRVEVLIPYRHIKRIVNRDHNYEQVITDHVAKLEAWMYIGRYKYWQDFLDAGYHFKPCKIYEPGRLILPGKYYSFTDLEYDD